MFMVIMIDGNGCRTKDNRSMVEDVDDIVVVIFLSFKQYDIRILSERITCTTINARDKRHKEFVRFLSFNIAL